jgi:uncharacterized protein YegP (UPF0339 family)
MAKTTKPDRIVLYRTTDKTREYRWTRRSAVNGNVIAASTQGYNTARAARANIERTQKQPYVISVL